jgi:plasmid maintenance system antidote protein VapI
MPNRIPSARLRRVRRQIFEGRYTASSLATRLRVSPNTFWVMFHRPNGITIEMAYKIARQLDVWATAIGQLANEIRCLGLEYDTEKEKSA